MGFLTGGSKQKSDSVSTSQQQSNSYNQAYPWLQQQLGGAVQGATKSQTALENLLGLNGTPAQDTGFENYKNSTGYDFLMNQGSRAITQNKAANGLLGSGSFAKALQNYGQNTANSFFGSYLDRLLQSNGAGMNAANLIAGAGNVSNSSGSSNSNSSSTGSSSQGIGGILGGVGSIIAASDPRLKENIEQIGTLGNGLPVYKFDYIVGDKNQIGVMSTDVERIQPEALGPVINGYGTVDYSKIEGWGG